MSLFKKSKKKNSKERNVFDSASDKYMYLRDRSDMDLECLRCHKTFGMHCGLNCPEEPGEFLMLEEVISASDPNMAFKLKGGNHG